MENIDNILELASNAFWTSIAASFPQITTGDLSIETTIALDDMMKKAVIEWVDTNKK